MSTDDEVIIAVVAVNSPTTAYRVSKGFNLYQTQGRKGRMYTSVDRIGPSQDRRSAITNRITEIYISEPKKDKKTCNNMESRNWTNQEI